MLFQACRDSSVVFLHHNQDIDTDSQSIILLRQKHLNYLISQLKPVLTDIISQGISRGEIHFEHPAALAEIALIVLTVKLNNAIISTTPEETNETINGLIALLEKGTGIPAGTLGYLSLTK